MSSTHESRAQRPERKSEVELKNTIIHEKKTHFQFGMNRRMTARHGAARCSAARQRHGRHSGGYADGHVVFRPGDQADLRHRRRHRPDWRSAGLSDFFKQKTAYEISECDWSSDVCSSDLSAGLLSSTTSVNRRASAGTTIDRKSVV